MTKNSVAPPTELIVCWPPRLRWFISIAHFRKVPRVDRMLNKLSFELTLPVVHLVGLSLWKFETKYSQESIIKQDLKNAGTEKSIPWHVHARNYIVRVPQVTAKATYRHQCFKVGLITPRCVYFCLNCPQCKKGLQTSGAYMLLATSVESPHWK